MVRRPTMQSSVNFAGVAQLRGCLDDVVRVQLVGC